MAFLIRIYLQKHYCLLITISNRKMEARNFDTIHDILRSKGLAISLLNGRNASICRTRTRGVKLNNTGEFYHAQPALYIPIPLGRRRLVSSHYWDNYFHTSGKYHPQYYRIYHWMSRLDTLFCNQRPLSSPLVDNVHHVDKYKPMVLHQIFLWGQALRHQRCKYIQRSSLLIRWQALYWHKTCQHHNRNKMSHHYRLVRP